MAIARIGSLLLAAGALALAGCGGDGSAPSTSSPDGPAEPGLACTEIGCSSGLQLDLSPIARQFPDAKQVRVCLDESCKTFSPSDQLAMVSEPRIESKADVHVTLTVLDASGQTLMRDGQTARIARVRPNGPHCQPVCFQVLLALDAKRLKLTRTPAAG
jgi:hypothetical protein